MRVFVTENAHHCGGNQLGFVIEHLGHVLLVEVGVFHVLQRVIFVGDFIVLGLVNHVSFADVLQVDRVVGCKLVRDSLGSRTLESGSLRVVPQPVLRPFGFDVHVLGFLGHFQSGDNQHALSPGQVYRLHPSEEKRFVILVEWIREQALVVRVEQVNSVFIGFVEMENVLLGKSR